MLTDELLADFDPTYKVNPPLRTAADVEAVRAALADGTIDAVATDHAPHPPHTKQLAFADAPPGMLGLEAALPVVLTELVRPGLIGLSRAVEVLSVAPARSRRLAGHGGPIEPGAPGQPRPVRPRGDLHRRARRRVLAQQQRPVGRPAAARPGRPHPARRAVHRPRRKGLLMADALLVLVDGTVVEGAAFGAATTTVGELVFNTAMTGYQEVLTDPSYRGQIVTMTAAHVGTYGLNDDDGESGRIQLSGFVVRRASAVASNWRSQRTLHEGLAAAGVPGIADVDTRALVRRLRSAGAVNAALSTDGTDAAVLLEAARSAPAMVGNDLASGAGTAAGYEVAPAGPHRGTDRPLRVVALDFGVKASSPRMLAERGCRVKVLPMATDAEQILAAEPDGLYVSNGPGDPAALADAVAGLRRVVAAGVPTFGICLGHQLLARAAGASTYKLAHGHHGVNQPVRRLSDGGGADHQPQPRVRRGRERLRLRAARDGRGDPRQPQRRRQRGDRVARPAGVQRPVPPGGRARPPRRPRAVRLLCRPDAPQAPSGARRRGHERHERGCVMPARADLSTILVIGSGPIVIGQACEFDYSGTQAIKALRAEGYRVVLVNSNPATIMTDPELADATYVEPLTVESVTRVIQIERPDALLPTLGGQTGLNLAVALDSAGVLDAHDVELLGANLATITVAEDRRAFADLVESIGLATPPSGEARTREQARALAARFGFPVLVRSSFTLGGAGSGVAHNDAAFDTLVTQALAASGGHPIQVDAYLAGWKEFELEVIRDRADNCIVVCPIENVDAMGVHTGDSVTVAPTFTLTDREYQAMRDDAFAILRAVGVETGGANVQFAVDPATGQRVVVEMNPRVSRSSALASKATGFPIAKVAALLAVGYTLDELPNDVTGTTSAAFEPSIDYVVVKLPRFAFDKFPDVEPVLGSRMRSVGEVMAIGSDFAEAFGKALRSMEDGRLGLSGAYPAERTSSATADVGARQLDDEALAGALVTPTPERVHAIDAALTRGWSVERVAGLAGWDRWFVAELAGVVATRED